jgi:hypothetical protein
LAEGTAFAAVGDFGGGVVSGGGGVMVGLAAAGAGDAIGVGASSEGAGVSAEQATEKTAGQTTNKTIAVLTRTFSHRNKQSTL